MIRKAEMKDIPTIVSLVEDNLDTLLPRTASEYKDFIDFTWVAEHNGEIVGSCLLEVYSPKIAEIRSFVVKKEYRSQGFGKLLIEAAVAEGEKRNIREIMVVTSTPGYFGKLNFGECLHEKYALFWNGKSSGQS